MKQLIVTADDFGLCHEVNEAVIQAHTQGILTCASLMVGAKGTDEAIQLAKNHPTLKVGLHLVLVEGYSVLPKREIPDLVDENKRFSNHIVWSGIRYFFSPKLKKQIAKECEAQIQKFLEAGLKIDHLNSHNHLHIHPTISKIVLKLAKKYSIPAIRIPYRLFPFSFFLKRRLKQASILHNDHLLGLSETGRMGEETWLKLIPHIKEGVTEAYCHPATETTGVLKETMPRYCHREELEALLSPRVKESLDHHNIQRISFGDLS